MDSMYRDGYMIFFLYYNYVWKHWLIYFSRFSLKWMNLWLRALMYSLFPNAFTEFTAHSVTKSAVNVTGELSL